MNFFDYISSIFHDFFQFLDDAYENNSENVSNYEKFLNLEATYIDFHRSVLEACNLAFKEFDFSTFHDEDLKKVRNHILDNLSNHRDIPFPSNFIFRSFMKDILFIIIPTILIFIFVPHVPIFLVLLTIVPLLGVSIYFPYVKLSRNYFKEKNRNQKLIDEALHNIDKVQSLLRMRDGKKNAIEVDYSEAREPARVNKQYLMLVLNSIKEKISLMPDSFASVYLFKYQIYANLLQEDIILSDSEIEKLATELEGIDTQATEVLENLHIHSQNQDSFYRNRNL